MRQIDKIKLDFGEYVFYFWNNNDYLVITIDI